VDGEGDTALADFYSHHFTLIWSTVAALPVVLLALAAVGYRRAWSRAIVGGLIGLALVSVPSSLWSLHWMAHVAQHWPHPGDGIRWPPLDPVRWPAC
jgi:hypothetical protein